MKGSDLLDKTDLYPSKNCELLHIWYAVLDEGISVNDQKTLDKSMLEICGGFGDL